METGYVVAKLRRSLGLHQGDVAVLAGIGQETLSRFERGNMAEFGSRKLLAVLGMELQISETVASGSLDDLLRESGGA